MEYVIECRDHPWSHWYILGSCKFEHSANREADCYRKMLWQNGCGIRVRQAGSVA